MSIMAWLKGLTRRRLDDDDFQDEIRAHLAIAADERMADGADPKTRAPGVAEGLRQRHADDGSGPPGLDAVVARRACAIR